MQGECRWVFQIMRNLFSKVWMMIPQAKARWAVGGGYMTFIYLKAKADHSFFHGTVSALYFYPSIVESKAQIIQGPE